MGFNQRQYRECVHALNLSEPGLGEIFEELMQLLEGIAAIIVKEMFELEKDMAYWRLLSAMTPWYAAYYRWNEQLYRSILKVVGRTIINSQRSLSRLNHQRDHLCVLELSWGKYLFHSHQCDNEKDGENLRNRVTVIRAVHRELAGLYSTVFEVINRLFTIYTELQLNELSYYSYVKNHMLNSPNKLAETRSVFFDDPNIDDTAPIAPYCNELKEEDKSSLSEFSHKVIQSSLFSVIEILKCLDGTISNESRQTLNASISNIGGDVRDRHGSLRSTAMAEASQEVFVSLSSLKSLLAITKSSYGELIRSSIMNKVTYAYLLQYLL